MNTTTTKIKNSSSKHSFILFFFFFSVIERIYYFITIRNLNVNDYNAGISFIEPNITDFNDYLNHIAFVSYYFPFRANRIYLKREENLIDVNSLTNALRSAWTNAQIGKAKQKFVYFFMKF